MDDASPPRRRVLVGGLGAAATAVAGCLGGRDVSRPDPERSLVLTLSADGGSLREKYVVDVTRERFHEPVYRATAEPVADSPERMEAILRAKFLDARFAREDLSSEAQQILQSARGDGYAESHPYSSAYRRVLRTLHAYPYLDGYIENDALPNDHAGGTVRYDGEYYDYRLRFRNGDG